MEGLAGVSESLRLLVTVSRASLHTPPDQFELVSPPPWGSSLGQMPGRHRAFTEYAYTSGRQRLSNITA